MEATVGDVEAWNRRRHIVVDGDDAEAEGQQFRHGALHEFTEMPLEDDGFA